jgi:hypothetical protein
MSPSFVASCRIEMVIFCAAAAAGIPFGAVVERSRSSGANAVLRVVPKLWLFAMGRLFILVASFPRGLAGLLTDQLGRAQGASAGADLPAKPGTGAGRWARRGHQAHLSRSRTSSTSTAWGGMHRLR